MESILKFTSLNNDMMMLNEIIKDTLSVDIMNPRRNRDVVDARRIYAKILKDLGYGLTQIGVSLGRDHTIIIHYIQTAEDFINTDYIWAANYLKCRDKFHENRAELKMNEVELKKSVTKLTRDNEFYIREREKYMKLVDKYDRFDFIIQYLDERVPRGSEKLVRDKIIRMLNE
jgi:hypothetical protein